MSNKEAMELAQSKKFWQDLLIEYETRCTNYSNPFICNNSDQFGILWNNKKTRDFIILNANEFNASDFTINSNVDIINNVLFYPNIYRRIGENEEFKIRIKFINHMINTCTNP